VAQLGDAVFRVREGATVQLRKLGRAAKPVVVVTIKTTKDPEIRSRCETLFAQLEKDDLQARLHLLLADTKNHYQHDLPGWKQLAAITGSTTHAKQLYANLCQTPQNWELLKGITQSNEQLATLVTQRRNQLFFIALRVNRNFNSSHFTGADIAGLLLCEIQLGTVQSGRDATNSLETVLFRIREELTGESGEPLRKLTLHWMDSRTEPVEILSAIRIAGQLKLNDAPIARYGEKLLTPKSDPVLRTNALTLTAQYGGKEVVNLLTKHFKDESKQTIVRIVDANPLPAGAPNDFIVNKPVQEKVELQTRDVALAMCLLVNGLNPYDFGFASRYPPSLKLTDMMKYNTGQYLLLTPEKRQAAFGQYKEWAANPKK
jgi:hypothetical protein